VNVKGVKKASEGGAEVVAQGEKVEADNEEFVGVLGLQGVFEGRTRRARKRMHELKHGDKVGYHTLVLSRRAARAHQ